MKPEHIVLLLYAGGGVGSLLFGYLVEEAPSPVGCFFWYWGACMLLVLLLFLLRYLHSLAAALARPGECEPEPAAGLVGCLLSLGMGGGLLCKYLGPPEALEWWIYGVFAFCAFGLLLFLVLLAAELLHHR